MFMNKSLPNVLIVDDDVQMIDIINLYLKKTANVYSALSGFDALELLKQQSIDVILLDIEMPGMNGFETLEQIRKIESCSKIPVIFVTGHRDKYANLNTSVLGIDGYLLKPVSKEILIEKIMELYQKTSKSNLRKTILLIDDDVLYLKQLNSLLKESYHVIMLNSSKLAHKYLTTHSADLMLLDYQMPECTGAEFMKEIKKNFPEKQIPVILMTGTLSQHLMEEFDAYVPSAYLEKPMHSDVLLEHIERILRI